MEQNDFNIKLIFIMINSEYRTVLVASDGYYVKIVSDQL